VSQIICDKNKILICIGYEILEPSSSSAITKVIIEFSDCYADTMEQELTEGKELPEGITLDEQTRKGFQEIAIKAFQFWYTKGVVQGKPPSPLQIGPSSNDVHGSARVTGASQRSEFNPTPEEKDTNYPQESGQTMSAKQACKRRAASCSENSDLQSSRCLQSTTDTSVGISDSFGDLQDGLEGLTSRARFYNFSLLNTAAPGSFPQEFQPSQINQSAEGAIYNVAQMPTQSIGYGPNAGGVHPPYIPGSAYDGMTDYSSCHNQNIPTVNPNLQYNNGGPPLNKPPIPKRQYVQQLSSRPDDCTG
jgi:hypothetical protein